MNKYILINQESAYHEYAVIVADMIHIDGTCDYTLSVTENPFDATKFVDIAQAYDIIGNLTEHMSMGEWEAVLLEE
ncbi:hypothetical protein [Vibrio phage JSF4]|nr:hypothetical protein TUST1-2_00750 [Vibrio phage ICP1_2001_A]APD17992.1 hypothetical protein [Vibrio phage JSF4]